MERISKKKLITVVIVVLSIVMTSVLLNTISIIAFGKIDPYILTRTDVFVPTGYPLRFHYTVFSIDTFDYWVFKLDEAERVTIRKEYNDSESKWSVMNNYHIEQMEELKYYDRIIQSSAKKHICYLCIYDIVNQTIITNEESGILNNCSNWVILLYDVDANRYYCIRESY